MPPDDLVVAALGGDRDAVEGLLRWVRPVAVRYCRARIGRQHDAFTSADDVAQEICLAVLTSLARYRDQGKPFLAFVYGIAAHKVADAHRAASRNRSDPTGEFPDVPSPVDGPEQRALRGELSEQLGELLDILPERHREIVVLRVVLGLSAEETAAAVGSTPGAVRVAQHRALTRLRTALAPGARAVGATRSTGEEHHYPTVRERPHPAGRERLITSRHREQPS